MLLFLADKDEDLLYLFVVFTFYRTDDLCRPILLTSLCSSNQALVDKI